MNIILATINAKYIHASLGLRYLYAQMGDLQHSTELLEFTINQNVDVIVEDILQKNPAIIGFGVYIWNTIITERVISLIKTIRPDIRIILGGPEISHETELQSIAKNADFIITGQADFAFAQLCHSIIDEKAPEQQIIRPANFGLNQLAYPYRYYSDEDIAHRVLYVEASRGCPFKCEFCLSSLDKTAWPFDLDAMLFELEALYMRGARHFKFVDRTFNLKIKNSLKILDFFLDKIINQQETLFLHFELIPDHLPDALKEKLVLFPPDCLQFEIGIQSFTPEVQDNISRRQDNDKSTDNITWLKENTHAHLHVDLIFGLPGETFEQFGASFNRLFSIRPHEIQMGILKRLRGTPIVRHEQEFMMKYNPDPPYDILQTSTVDYFLIRRINRFARYWDMIVNSGRFSATIDFWLDQNAFEQFLTLSDSIFERCGQTHKIELKRLFRLVHQTLTECFDCDHDALFKVMSEDYYRCGFHHQADFTQDPQQAHKRAIKKSAPNQRQAQHKTDDKEILKTVDPVVK